MARGMDYRCADWKRGFSVHEHTVFERSLVLAQDLAHTRHRKGISSTQVTRHRAERVTVAVVVDTSKRSFYTFVHQNVAQDQILSGLCRRVPEPSAPAVDL